MSLKNFRESQGLKQFEAAERLGITNDYLSMIENGKRTPGNKLTFKMAELYAVKPEDIFLTANRTICTNDAQKEAS